MPDGFGDDAIRIAVTLGGPRPPVNPLARLCSDFVQLYRSDGSIIPREDAPPPWLALVQTEYRRRAPLLRREARARIVHAQRSPSARDGRRRATA